MLSKSILGVSIFEGLECQNVDDDIHPAWNHFLPLTID